MMKLVLFLVFAILQLTSFSAAQDDDGDADGTATEFTHYDVHSLPCVLIRINASIAIEPKRVANKKYVVELPRHAEVKGKCGNGMDSQIVLKWGASFQLTWHFQKSHVSDAWYVDKILFTYNTDEKVFNGEIEGGGVQEIGSPDSFTLWLTPIGQAYSCRITQEIKLLDVKKQRRVTLTLREIRIQPFASMTRRRYGDYFVCPKEAGRRDETVPIAVGSTLAIVVLLTVSGYAGYRYFKVKKIEYDTME